MALAVCLQCKVLYVSKHSNPSFGPFPQVCCSITGFSTLLLHLGCAIFYFSARGGRVRQPLLILSPLLGTPENAGVMQPFRPLLGPREGRGETATFDFVPFLGDPRKCRGYVALLGISPMDLGLMCLSQYGHNRMLQKMMKKMMTVFVVNYVLTVMKIYRSVLHFM